VKHSNESSQQDIHEEESQSENSEIDDEELNIYGDPENDKGLELEQSAVVVTQRKFLDAIKEKDNESKPAPTTNQETNNKSINSQNDLLMDHLTNDKKYKRKVAPLERYEEEFKL